MPGARVETSDELQGVVVALIASRRVGDKVVEGLCAERLVLSRAAFCESPAGVRWWVDRSVGVPLSVLRKAMLADTKKQKGA